MKKQSLLSAFLMCSIVGNAQNGMMGVDEAYEKADSLLKTFTITEKAEMVRGYNRFFINGFSNKGMHPIYMSDATQGVHIRSYLKDKSLPVQLKKSTAFPAPILLASTFSPDLAFDYAKAIGEECRAGGIEILLGPGLNIQRQSQCARNFEYFGEDPYLTSQMVVQYVKGMQSTGTASCLKHFYGNNTEFYRKRSNSVIDERAMNEIYLPGFEAGIKAGAKCVMTSYNLIDGEWSGQSSYVIKELLRKKLGFQWLVMSDWESVWDLEKVIKSGQNLEMPGSYDFGVTVLDLIKQKKVTEANLDSMIRPILATCISMDFYKREKYKKSLLEKFPEHEKVAHQVAQEGIVLLKNKNNILPLDPKVNRKILLTGRFVHEIPRGYGSAEVVGYNNVSLLEALQQVYGYTVYCVEKPSVDDLKTADVVILSMGTRDEEAIERPFALPKKDEEFMRFVTEHNPNTIAVVNAGSAIDMSAWNDKLAALIYGWYGGQSGFVALAEILSGKINPSGKLPMTIEKSFKDSPAYGYLPPKAQFYTEFKNQHMINLFDVKYTESVLVGYRWYDTKNIAPLYPFGFGLSYTEFDIMKAKLSARKMTEGGKVFCEVTIKNTGDRAGAEVVQLYVNENNPTVLRPEKELKGFKKVYLNPGEQKTVSFEITERELSYWSLDTHNWESNKGKFSILLGTSSRNIEKVLSLEKE